MNINDITSKELINYYTRPNRNFINSDPLENIRENSFKWRKKLNDFVLKRESHFFARKIKSNPYIYKKPPIPLPPKLRSLSTISETIHQNALIKERNDQVKRTKSLLEKIQKTKILDDQKINIHIRSKAPTLNERSFLNNSSLSGCKKNLVHASTKEEKNNLNNEINQEIRQNYFIRPHRNYKKYSFFKENANPNSISTTEQHKKKPSIAKQTNKFVNSNKINNSFHLKTTRDNKSQEKEIETIHSENYRICSARITNVLDRCTNFLEKEFKFDAVQEKIKKIDNSIDFAENKLKSFREHSLLNNYLEPEEIEQLIKENKIEERKITGELKVWLENVEERIDYEKIMKMDLEMNNIKKFKRKHNFKKSMQEIKRLK